MPGRCVISFTIMLSAVCCSSAQTADSTITRAVAAAVQLDPVVITAAAEGFDVEDFIRLVQEDQSLYQAFRNLRYASHRFTTKMEFFDKKDRTKSTYTSENLQTVEGNCRSLEITDEEAGGNFFKGRKNRHRYYTARLYDRVFVTHGVICSEISDTLISELPDDADKTEGHINELKKLIFTPGRKSDVPLIGKKTEVFSERMLPYYDFEIHSDVFNGHPVYIFEARVKGDYEDKGSKTVFRHLVTYFSKEDFQVLARRYHLEHRNAIYRFDVQMSVDLTRIRGRYYPTKVSYNGMWNVPGRKREAGNFTVLLSDFR